jgi:hypothetical protein
MSRRSCIAITSGLQLRRGGVLHRLQSEGRGFKHPFDYEALKKSDWSSVAAIYARRPLGRATLVVAPGWPQDQDRGAVARSPLPRQPCVRVSPQRAAEPRVQVHQHPGRLTEAEIASPTLEVGAQLGRPRLQTYSPYPARQFPHSLLEPDQRLYRKCRLTCRIEFLIVRTGRSPLRRSTLSRGDGRRGDQSITSYVVLERPLTSPTTCTFRCAVEAALRRLLVLSWRIKSPLHHQTDPLPVLARDRLLLLQADGSLHQAISRGDRLGVGFVSAFGHNERGEFGGDIHIGRLK